MQSLKEMGTRGSENTKCQPSAALSLDRACPWNYNDPFC
jgi:hypothetical protein